MGNEDKQKTFVKTKFSEKPTTFAERIAFSGEKSMGHLIASTRTLSATNLTDFAAGNNLITNSTATAATGDIVNTGKLQASSVVLEGKDVRMSIRSRRRQSPPV